jgi:photosystem II stability/assembly factor-like uncharacterized protein
MKKKLLFIILQFSILNFSQTQTLGWQLTTPFSRLQDVLKMEIFPDRSYFVLKQYENDNMFITENNGKTWRHIINTGDKVYDFKIYNNKGYLLLGSDLRIADPKFSTPGVTYPLPSSAFPKALFVLNDTTIFVSTYNGKVLRSTNGGATWNVSFVPTIYTDRVVDIFFTDANTGYCVTQATLGNSFIFKSIDGGQTWNTVSISHEKYEKIVFKNAMNGIASRYNGSAQYTIDGGNTWNDAVGVNYLKDIKIYNNEFIAIGSPNKLYRTATGESWSNTIMYPSLFHVFTSLAIHPDFFLAGTDNETGDDGLRYSIFKSTDLQNWTPTDVKWYSAALYDKAYASENLAIVPYNYFSKDKGISWEVVNNNLPAGPMNILPNGKGIAIGRNTTQFWTTNNNGLTWTAGQTPYPGISIPAMKPNGNFVISTVGTGSTVNVGYITKYDAATGWTPPINVESWVSCIKFVDDNVGFLINKTKIMKTIDGGTTWTALTNYPAFSTEIQNIRDIVFGNSSKIYFGKYYTTDLGSSWYPVNSTIGLFKDYEIFPDGTGYGMTSSERHVFKTLDFGSTWQKIVDTDLYTTPSTRIRGAAFAKNYMIAVGSSGFYVIDLVTGNLTTNDVRVETNNKLRIYPNPTSSIVFFDIKEKVKNVMVLDITGRIFKNIENPKENSIDIADLEKGSYFMKIITENKIYLEKVIKK